MIVASIVQDGNFNSLLTEGNDIALLAERVIESFQSWCVNIRTYYTGYNYMQVVQEDLELNGRTFGASRSDDGQGMYVPLLTNDFI